MPLRTIEVAHRDALSVLADEIHAAKADDLLERVTVVVPTNACGVMARRALGRRGGAVAIDMVTLNRLAELLAGPALAAAGRSPISAPVVDLTIAAVLAERPGAFAAVADHPSTIVALRELHTELRLAGDQSVHALAVASRRGGEAVRISNAIVARLRRDWYDEADLFADATDAIDGATTAGLRRIIVYLPQDLAGRPLAFVSALASAADVCVIAEDDGEPPADALPRRVVSTTDADDEARIATRTLVDAARAGTPFERMAVLWPAHEPYARLVEHHLGSAGIRWNGRPGTTLGERLVCRLLLDLLDLDQRGLRRRDLFALLADVPARDADGSYLPSASWERLSREAGVARDADWAPRLAAYRDHERFGPAARGLSDFVDGLRSSLGHRAQTRRWWDWSDWCRVQLERWIGRPTLERLPEAEYRAWESLTAALDRLRHLDPVGEPVTRHVFRATLAAELDAMPAREGRIGDGVTVGPLEGAVGLDVDVAIVLGAAEGTMPPVPRSDPLISETDRATAGLVGSDARAVRLHRRLHAIVATAETTITVPRGDLRSTASREPSRWIAAWSGATDLQSIESHTAGLVGTEFPASPTEHRLRTRYAKVLAGSSVLDTPDAAEDEALVRGLRLVAARDSDRLTEYDGDLSSIDVPALDGAVSPSRLEQWTSCPHAYFLRYLLHVRPIEDPDDEITITPLERGSVYHDALDLFHRAVIAGELPQPATEGWTDVHRAALVAFFTDVCDRAEARGRTGRPAYWSGERRRMEAELLEWLERDGAVSRQRGATVIASEHGFDADDRVELALPGGRTLQVRGKIDRVDRAADGSLIVTDHKTGANSYKDLDVDDPTMAGAAFQLPSYAAAALALVGDHELDVLAEYSLLSKGKYARPGYVLTDGTWTLVGSAIGSVVRGIESGYFPNLPQRPGFRMYVDCQFCEPDGLGTAERWSEWVRKRHDPAIASWFAPESPGSDSEPSPDISPTTRAATT
jgi:ATP-dependent helicase/nuclease subunit B